MVSLWICIRKSRYYRHWSPSYHPWPVVYDWTTSIGVRNTQAHNAPPPHPTTKVKIHSMLDQLYSLACVFCMLLCLEWSNGMLYWLKLFCQRIQRLVGCYRLNVYKIHKECSRWSWTWGRLIMTAPQGLKTGDVMWLWQYVISKWTSTMCHYIGQYEM